MAHIGWLNVAAIRVAAGEVEEVRTGRLDTCLPEDRVAREPYHVAGGFDVLKRVALPPDPAGTVEEGLSRQRKVTAANLEILLGGLPDWNAPISWAALFTGRGRTPDSLIGVLASHASIHVAEGNAVRQALMHACANLGIPLKCCDKRDFPETVSTTLERSQTDALNAVAKLKPQAGPWRKDEKLCALAAWVALRAAP